MLFLLVVAIVLVMALLALAGPVLEDLLEWVRPEVRRHRADRVARHGTHR